MASDVGESVAPKGRKKRLNVVLITCDQERRWSDLPQGFPFSSALPNRARLLRESTAFTQMNVASCPCTPSRATLWSGRHFQETGVYANNQDLGDTPSIGNILREHGYYTAYKGKWHLTRNLRSHGDDKEKHESWARIMKDLFPASEPPPPFGASIDYVNGLEPNGFSDWNPEGESVSPLEGFEMDPGFAAAASDWLRGKGAQLSREGHPFFLAVNFVNPHDVMFFQASERQVKERPTPRGIAALFEFSPAPSDPLYKKWWGVGVPHKLHAHSKANAAADISLALPPAHGLHFDRIGGILGKFASDEDYETHLNYYLNCLVDVDRHIGTVLDTLDETGLAQNTIVVLCADHGELAGAHGLREKGGPIYKENMGVPLLVRHPDAPLETGQTCNNVISLVDLVPTLLSLTAGSDCLADLSLPGHDFAPYLMNPKQPGPRDESGALFQYAGVPKLAGSFVQAIITPQYSFGRFFGVRDSCPTTIEELLAGSEIVLFDRLEDPDELHNLAGSPELIDRHRSLIAELNEKLNALLEKEAKEKIGVNMPWKPYP